MIQGPFHTASSRALPSPLTHAPRLAVVTAAQRRDDDGTSSQLGPRLKLKPQTKRQDSHPLSDAADRAEVHQGARSQKGVNRMDRQPMQTGVASMRPAVGMPHASQPSHAAETQTQGAAALSRRVAILVDLLHTDSNQLESKLARMSSEIDDEAIGLLEERLQAARLYRQQGTPAVQQVEKLYHLLKRAHQRRQASPAMRLLDDVLELLGYGSDPAPSGERVKPGASRGPAGGDMQLVQAYEQRRFKARSLLRDAFARHEDSSGSGAVKQEAGAARAMPRPEQQPAGAQRSRAAAAAEGAVEGKGASIEAVCVDEFLREAAVVLEAAEGQQRQLKQLTGRRPREDFQPRVDKQLQQALAALEECTVSVAQLEDVLTIARSLRLCPAPEQD